MKTSIFQKSKVTLASAALVVGMASMPNAYAANTASATASVTILQAIAVTQNTNMAFPDTYATGSIQTVASTVSAVFDVTGVSGVGYDITVDATASLIDTGGGGGTAMTATLTAPASATLTGGATTFSVTGSLAVAANQVASTYAGTFNVQVDYQ